MGMIMHDDVPYGEGTSYTPGTGIAINNNIIAVDADNTPTEGSEKPVKSKGVYSAVESVEEEIEQIYADNGVLGAKNLLPLTLSGIKALNSSRTWNGNSCEHNGITFTVNVDDKGNVTSISESGTATRFAFLRITSIVSFSGSYILNKGISANKFVYIQNETTNVQIAISTGGDTLVNLTPTNDVINCIVGVEQGQTGDGTFYPMLRLASDPDDTYVPYAMTNRELTDMVSVESLNIDLTASDKANKMRDDSKRCGNVVNIRIQLQVVSEIPNNTEIFRLNGLPHKGYGMAIMGDSNEGTLIPMLAVTSNYNFSMSCRKAIPIGYYAISYTYII